MRKRYKRKSKSLCAMCKAHKVSGERRWTGKALDGIQRFERERSEWLGKPCYTEANHNLRRQ